MNRKLIRIENVLLRMEELSLRMEAIINRLLQQVDNGSNQGGDIF